MNESYKETIQALFQWREHFLKRIPSLDEVRAAKIPHGRLVGIGIRDFTSGMMIGSETFEECMLVPEEDGAVLTIGSKSLGKPVVTRRCRCGSRELEALQAISEAENLIGWSFLKRDMARETFVPDRSESSTLTLIYEAGSTPGGKTLERSVDMKAAEQQGGTEVLLRLRTLLKEAEETGEALP